MAGHAGKRMLMAAACLTGCGSRLHVLDHGHVTVSGLQRTAQAVHDDLSVFPEAAQSRQSVTLRLAPSVLKMGHYVTVLNESTSPPAVLLEHAAAPAPGSKQDLDLLQFAQTPDDAFALTFSAGQAARRGLLTYGENILRVQVYSDLGLTFEGDVHLQLRDFENAGLLLGFFPRADSSDGDHAFKGWVANFVVPTAAEDHDKAGESSSYLQAGWYAIINP